MTSSHPQSSPSVLTVKPTRPIGRISPSTEEMLPGSKFSFHLSFPFRENQLYNITTICLGVSVWLLYKKRPFYHLSLFTRTRQLINFKSKLIFQVKMVFKYNENRFSFLMLQLWDAKLPEPCEASFCLKVCFSSLFGHRLHFVSNPEICYVFLFENKDKIF